MDLKELTTFLAAADAGSITRASERLDISSVSVMNRINSLEEALQVRLFVRTNHGVRLTAAGESFYQSTKELLEQADRAVARARKIEAEGEKVIRIGTSVMRPCRELVDLWERAAGPDDDLQIEIVSFSDKRESLSTLLSSSDSLVDCFLSPCDSLQWQQEYGILLLRHLPCRVGVPRSNPLSAKKSLTWEDLDGETLMLITSGFSPVMKRMADDIRRDHPHIHLADIPYYYDTGVFNRAVQMGFLTETLDIWKEAHPSLVVLPAEWDYAMPYGIVYPKEPRRPVRQFIDKIARLLEAEGVRP